MNNPIIDLEDELLIDSSRVVTPHLRLLLVAIGKPVATGSAWFAVNKEVAALYRWPTDDSLDLDESIYSIDQSRADALMSVA